MMTNPTLSAVLGGGHALLVDLVTLHVQRGRIWQFPGGVPTEVPIVDTVRWTSAGRRLRTASTAPGGAATFEAPAGLAYQRGRLSSEAGASLLQISVQVAGDLPISLSTAADGSGSFATTLGELALLEMLDGCWITIDQAAVAALPAAPVQGSSGYGDLTPDPVRVFGGVVRAARPEGGRVALSIVDPLALGGGSVPVSLFSPLCRWTFCEGGCPVVRSQSTDNNATCTHRLLAGSQVSFPDARTVVISPTAADLAQWAYLVPLDGPMMGMRFEVGGAQETAGHYDFADSMPWPWSCDQVHIEYACEHRRTGNLWSCTRWGALAAFGGFPEMPDPESGE